MRYNELVKELQNFTNEEIKPNDMALATRKSASTFTYKKAVNGLIKAEDIPKIIEYVKKKYCSLKPYETPTRDNNETYEFDYYPEVFGSCGNGAFVLSEEKQKIVVPKSALFSKLSKVKKYSVINARGNSMQPFLYENDKLIIEHTESNEQIIDNRVYVFCFEEQIFIKRLFKNVNQLVVKSDNPEFDIIKLTGEELAGIKIIGQVVGLFRDLK